jgi:hypothetical protein
MHFQLQKKLQLTRNDGLNNCAECKIEQLQKISISVRKKIFHATKKTMDNSMLG